MSYSGTTIFTIVDVIILFVLIFGSAHAMTSNIVKELFRTSTLVGAIFIASCFHKSLAKFLYTHVTNGVSINVLNTFSIIILFAAFFALGKVISNYLSSLIGEVKEDKKEIVFKILLRFITLYVIFSVVIYIFHTKTRFLQAEKIKYSRGVIYKHLAKTGRDILNITTQSRMYYY